MEVAEPPVPKGLTDEQRQEIHERAIALVNELEGASGTQELELVDSMTNLGIQAQRSAGKELDLLRGRVGDMITNGGPGESLTKELVELRLQLKKIDPSALGQQNFIKRTFGKMPPLKVLERIAIRYEPVSKQVTLIESRLRDGRAMLARDNVELRILYEQVEAQQPEIQKNAYMGELVMRQLEQSLERADDASKAERIRLVLHDVATRVEGLRIMETVHTQFFVSIEMTRQNNNRLGQSVERTLALATNVVTVGLAIQSALVTQNRILVATKGVQEFLGNVIVANAAAIKQHTDEIGDVYNSPVIAIEKITRAHDDLIDAMDAADRLKQKGIDDARENIAKLTLLSSSLQERASGLREQPALAEGSVEA